MKEIGRLIGQAGLSLKDAFKAFDTDGNGKIDQKEFRDAFLGMNIGLTV